MKHRLWVIGLLIFICGGVINGQLITHHIGGLLREGMRLIILIGLAIFFYGLFLKFQKDKKG